MCIRDRITPEVEGVIRDCIPLAPLHNPANLSGIEAARAAFPDLPHVAVFDTAFHQTMRPVAYRYAVPEEWYTGYGVRRYGFHGTSHQYVAEQAVRMLGLNLGGTASSPRTSATAARWRLFRTARAATPAWA